MKIEYKTYLDVNDKPCKFVEIRNAPCCEEIGKDVDYLEFGADDYPVPLAFLCITEIELGYYGDRTTHYHPISFCPFCGAKIVCEEIERVKVIQTRVPFERTVHDVRTERREEVVWRKE